MGDKMGYNSILNQSIRDRLCLLQHNLRITSLTEKNLLEDLADEQDYFGFVETFAKKENKSIAEVYDSMLFVRDYLKSEREKNTPDPHNLSKKYAQEQPLQRLVLQKQI